MTTPNAPAGPQLRTDMVESFVVRRAHAAADEDPGPIELLQIRRTRDPYAGTWQVCSGGIDPGEHAADAARRELLEELALDTRSRACLGFWRLNTVVPFYMPVTKSGAEAVFLAPCFAAEVAPGWEPTLNDEHDAHRWVALNAVRAHFVWPGQLAQIDELARHIALDSPARRHLRMPD